MAPLIILLVSFGIIFLINKLFLNRRLSLSFCGRISLSIMLLFTGITHFTNTGLMIQMLPDFFPIKKEIIYFTGVLELLAAAGLVIAKFSRLTSILLIIFFLLVLPANIIGSIKQVRLGGMESGVNYLYFRIPLQVFFILWTYFFGLLKNKYRN